MHSLHRVDGYGYRCRYIAIGVISVALMSSSLGRAQETARPTLNASQLDGPFSLDMAPKFDASEEHTARIDEVINELRRGYGGTLVVTGRDEVLDSPAFLSQYLRAFAAPNSTTPQGLANYDYCFERILSRLADTPSVLDDNHLDWDIWRAYLMYEDFATETGNYNEYKKTQLGSVYVHGLDSVE